MNLVRPRLLFDENLSPQLPRRLMDTFPNSLHVRDVTELGATDSSLWDLASSQGLVIVTKDDDFRRLSFLHGFPPKVIWLAVGNAGTTQIASLLTTRLHSISEFVVDPELSLLLLRLPLGR